MPVLNSVGIILSWVFTIITVVGFGGLALAASRRHHAEPLATPPEVDNSSITDTSEDITKMQGDEVDFFLTARKTQPMMRVTWSFLAGSMGAWIITAPASNASSSGLLGMLAYTIWSGLPIILVSLFGCKIQAILPTVLGFSDYVRLRFGVVVQFYVVLIILLNMGVALTAEYTSLSEIFDTVMGPQTGMVMVTVIGVVTMVYTGFGGLLVSIITDQYQAILGSSLIGMVVLFLSIMYRPSLPSFPVNLGVNDNGIGAVFTLPVSLFCATVFSESPWQRVLASESPRSLVVGSLLASFGISLIVLIFGSMGIFATWSGLVSDENSNSIVFVLLVEAQAPTWLLVMLMILAVTMCESAVDTAQNGLINTVSSMFLRHRPILWTRLAVLILNIPPMIISQLHLDIYSLFMIGNKLTSLSAFPLLLGIWPWSYRYITGPAVLFSALFSIFSLGLYGYLLSPSSSSFAKSLQFAFLDPYDIGTFLIPPTGSLLGLTLWILFTFLLTRLGYHNPPLLPGFQIANQFQPTNLTTRHPLED